MNADSVLDESFLAAARQGGRLPAGNGHGGVYDTTVLTEDNELTFALLHLGPQGDRAAGVHPV